MVVLHFFKKLRYSNERSTNLTSFHEYKYLEEENGKMVHLALQITQRGSLYGLGRQARKL